MDSNIKQMKHFIVGPVEMYPCSKAIYQKGYSYFRTEEFGNMVKKNLTRLSNLIGNKNENSLIYLTASGTAVMEATIENCVDENDKCLVINGGTFGKRFCELLEHHGKNYTSINLEFGEQLTFGHLADYNNKNYSMLFVNLHETSNGQLYDINLLSDFCKRNNMMLIVDAISTFLADEFDMAKFGIDVTIISSQKGLCISPGLSFISLSQRVIDKIKKAPKSNTRYFDFKDCLINIERGQTPYTPAVMIMYELDAILDYIEISGGKEKWLEKIKTKCDYFRKNIKDLGLKFPTSYNLSNMLTPVICDDVKASQVVKLLRDKYGLCVNPCGGALADKMFRVSHIGNTTIEDIDILLDKMSVIINKLKNEELVYDRK
ncbi:MAG: aminotransferase class V-fold PLP-dependent enzyme [bacterium]|nr:aminotransferase class V-fold PLP-dependent enzyme [bacterium]